MILKKTFMDQNKISTCSVTCVNNKAKYQISNQAWQKQSARMTDGQISRGVSWLLLSPWHQHWRCPHPQEVGGQVYHDKLHCWLMYKLIWGSCGTLEGMDTPHCLHTSDEQTRQFHLLSFQPVKIPVLSIHDFQFKSITLHLEKAFKACWMS